MTTNLPSLFPRKDLTFNVPLSFSVIKYSMHLKPEEGDRNTVDLPVCVCEMSFSTSGFGFKNIRKGRLGGAVG